MKWKKIDRFHLQSDEGYSICMVYLNRPADIDEVPDMLFVAFAPHRNNPEFSSDPDRSYMNARASLGRAKNLSGAKKICSGHFNKQEKPNDSKSDDQPTNLPAAS